MDDKALGEESRIVLIDNGSLNPNSVLEARSLAVRLSRRLDRPVDLVSVAHSNEIPETELEGVPAVLWQAYLENAGKRGLAQISVVPLFIGQGFALKKAKKIALSRSIAQEKIVVRWADPLVSRTDQDSLVSDILFENVVNALDTGALAKQKPRVFLVDHGSPFEEVTACRNYAAGLLRDSLGDRVESVVGCSMERREGKEFDFNEPSLESSLKKARADGVEQIILCYLFLFSGRHAGLGGDIDQICQKAGWKSGQNLLKTDLIGSRPKVLDLLEFRLKSIRPRG